MMLSLGLEDLVIVYISMLFALSLVFKLARKLARKFVMKLFRYQERTFCLVSS